MCGWGYGRVWVSGRVTNLHQSLQTDFCRKHPKKLPHPPMSTPSMKQVRDYFGIPPRQRWTTVARRGDFRRLLAPGENPRNLAPMLKNLYKLRGDATAQATLRRSAAGAARLARTQAQIADEATVNATREAAKTAAAAARAAAVEKRRHKRELLERYTDVTKSNRQGGRRMVHGSTQPPPGGVSDSHSAMGVSLPPTSEATVRFIVVDSCPAQQARRFCRIDGAPQATCKKASRHEGQSRYALS